MRTLRTESGAVYEYEPSAELIRRVNPVHEKRGDGEWQALLEPLPERNLEGERVELFLETLARYGGDDYGTPRELAFLSGVTTRITTPVVEDSWGR